MNVCSDLPAALTTLSCHADMFRHVGPLGLVLYVPLLIPIALAVIAVCGLRRPKRAAWRYDRITARPTIKRRY